MSNHIEKRDKTRQRHKQYQGVVTRSMIRCLSIHLWTRTKQRDNYRSKGKTHERRNLVAKTVSVTIRQTHSLMAIMILHGWNTNEVPFSLALLSFSLSQLEHLDCVYVWDVAGISCAFDEAIIIKPFFLLSLSISAFIHQCARSQIVQLKLLDRKFLCACHRQQRTTKMKEKKNYSQ